jgi:DNA polymerase III subunit beta
MSTETIPTIETAVSFTAAGFDIRDACAFLKVAKPPEYALPILSHVRIVADPAGIVTMTTTDLEVTAEASIAATVDAPGAFVVPFGQLVDACKGFRKPTAKNPAELVTVSADRAAVTLSTSASTANLATMPADEWPRLAPVEPVHRVTFTADDCAAVVGFASKDEARPILTGVLVTPERMVATDSYRLAWVDLAGHYSGPEWSALVPSKALRPLVKVAGEIRATFGEREASFSAGTGRTITTRLIEGEFPNYRGLVVDDPAPFRYVFADPAGTAKILAEHAKFGEVNTPTRLLSHTAGVELVTICQDRGQLRHVVQGSTPNLAEFPTAEDGETVKAPAFNPRYLADCLAGLAGPVNFDCHGSGPLQKPATIRHEDGRLLRLLMPVRAS